MAVIALHSAATGLNALSTKIDMIANNIANINTIGFKAQRANFEDLLYQEKAQPGVENANGDERPSGIHVGLGVRVASPHRDFQQGPPTETGRQLDWMVEGDGFFAVDILDNDGTGIGYTRAGNFFINSNGDIVLGNTDGPLLDPPINVPQDSLRVQVTRDGRVMAFQPGQPQPAQIGQIQLTSFINPNGLSPLGNNVFVETAASGPPIQGNPGDDNLGTVIQGFQESSNVDPVRELIELIKSQRAFELNSQTIQAADETLRVVGQLRR